MESTEVILHWMLDPLLQLPFLHRSFPRGCWSARHHFSSVAQSCLTLCSPIDCRLPCPSPTLELVQTHVHRVSDGIQPSHPLSSPSPPAFNFSQHQGVLQWVSSSHQVDKVLELQLQHQSFQWIFKTDFLYDGLFWSPCSPGTLKSLPNTTAQKHQFFGAQPSLWSNSHIHTWLLEKP